MPVVAVVWDEGGFTEVMVEKNITEGTLAERICFFSGWIFKYLVIFRGEPLSI